jgi:hypothetical protein
VELEQCCTILIQNKGSSSSYQHVVTAVRSRGVAGVEATVTGASGAKTNISNKRDLYSRSFKLLSRKKGRIRNNCGFYFFRFVSSVRGGHCHYLPLVRGFIYSCPQILIFVVLGTYCELTFMWPCIVTNLPVIKPTICTYFSNLFGNETLHVSDSSSVHHQELFTVHTAMVHDIQVCRQLLSSRIRMERSSILILLHSCLQTCMSYTIAVCTVNKLLIMDRGTVRNM